MHIHHLKTDLNEIFLTKFFCFDIMSVYPTKSQQLTRVQRIIYKGLESVLSNSFCSISSEKRHQRNSYSLTEITEESHTSCTRENQHPQGVSFLLIFLATQNLPHREFLVTNIFTTLNMGNLYTIIIGIPGPQTEANREKIPSFHVHGIIQPLRSRREKQYYPIRDIRQNKEKQVGQIPPARAKNFTNLSKASKVRRSGYGLAVLTDFGRTLNRLYSALVGVSLPILHSHALRDISQ